MASGRGRWTAGHGRVPPDGAVQGIVHVVGAGLAGLSAATALAAHGALVHLHEAAPQAGGRCRSYHDAALGMAIDNGNHLLVSGNRAALAYLDRIGGRDRLEEGEAAFDFMDLASGERWRLRPSRGPIPWWVLLPSRRVPGTRPRDYLALGRLARARGGDTVGDRLPAVGTLYDRLWHPLLLAALNTEPREASATLAAAVVRETLARGAGACRPLVVREGLSHALVDPALAYLAAHGASVSYGRRLRALERDGRAVTRLVFSDGEVAVQAGEAVVLAVPPVVAAGVVPGLVVPDAFRSIVNAHFRIAPPPGLPPVLGLVNGTAEWLFAYEGRLSTTTSGADRLLDTSREDLARTLWAETARAAGLPEGPMPPWQIVRERRATFAALPGQEARRPGTRTAFANLVLAGDYTATGLPATIEGAVRSGEAAAAAVLSRESVRHRAAPARAVVQAAA